MSNGSVDSNLNRSIFLATDVNYIRFVNSILNNRIILATDINWITLDNSIPNNSIFLATDISIPSLASKDIWIKLNIFT
jgi:hypothetical protein